MLLHAQQLVVYIVNTQQLVVYMHYLLKSQPPTCLNYFCSLLSKNTVSHDHKNSNYSSSQQIRLIYIADKFIIKKT